MIGSDEASGIYLGTLDGGEPKRLTAADSGSAARYLAPGLMVFVRQGALVARRLDVGRGELTGDPLIVVNSMGGIGRTLSSGVGGFSVSTDGSVAYRVGDTALPTLTWFDRTGKSLGLAGEPSGLTITPELSPDDQRVAVTRFSQGGSDVCNRKSPSRRRSP